MCHSFFRYARLFLLAAKAGVLTLVPQLASAVDSPEVQVAVLLARNCLECHNGSDRKGGLDLARREKALAGGDSGKALVPNDAKASLLLARVEAGEMPPKERKPLTAAERTLVREWIAAGAKWAADPIDPFLYTSDRRAGYNWWSLQPVRAVEPPPDTVGSKLTGASKDTLAKWKASPIDRFVLVRLEAAGLAPAAEADRRTLIRRVSFDLLGLPPTPEEVEEFVSDKNPRAYERLVDRLLDSAHYGERWARHWLDIVRFGESQGFERNKLRPNAWKYRDFVVEAFNSDLPYKDFIRWQIAGDVLRPDDPLAVIASGFLVVGPYDLTAYSTGTADMQKAAREEELEGLVATVCQTFLGLTVNCSRCHDHKFDPITQREFYQISAALGGTFHGDERESLGKDAKQKVGERITALRAELERLNNTDDKHERDSIAAVAYRSRLENLVRLLDGGPALTTNAKQPDKWRVLARGDFRSPGEAVSPRGIAAVSGVSADWSLAENAPEADRRKALAEWIAHENNPLTPRVIVNRLWGYHFGEGLVRTTSDFGFQGGQPSHPELLDWLAHELVRPVATSGPLVEKNSKSETNVATKPWSLKHIHRLILLSATYRQSSRGDAKGAKLDADNRLLWKRSPRRLEAETFHDAVLAVSDEFDPRIGGPGYRDFKVSSAGNNETYTLFEAFGGEFNRRSLYRTTLRAGTSPLLDMLDCPDPSVATPRRSITSTPLQALSLLNSPFMEHYAARLCDRLRRESPEDAAAQIDLAYSLLFARAPTDAELTFGRKFVGDHGLTQFCLVLLNANEFLYVD